MTIDGAHCSPPPHRAGHPVRPQCQSQHTRARAPHVTLRLFRWPLSEPHQLDPHRPPSSGANPCATLLPLSAGGTGPWTLNRGPGVQDPSPELRGRADPGVCGQGTGDRGPGTGDGGRSPPAVRPATHGGAHNRTPRHRMRSHGLLCKHRAGGDSGASSGGAAPRPCRARRPPRPRMGRSAQRTNSHYCRSRLRRPSVLSQCRARRGGRGAEAVDHRAGSTGAVCPRGRGGRDAGDAQRPERRPN